MSLHFYLPWQHLDPGQGSVIGSNVGDVCVASIRSLTQVTSAPRAGAHGPGEPSCPCSPVDGTMWTTLSAGTPCAGGCKKAQERQLLGRISLAPTWSCLAQLCLLLKLGLPAEGLGFAEGPDLPWAQHTVGVEQSWCVRELGLGLGLGWDTQAWVCPLAVLTGGHCSSPFSITSAFAG